MLLFAITLSLIPLTAFAVGRKASLEKISAAKSAIWTLAVFALGLIPALPLLTSRGVGSGEAYNTSLAVADFVTQVRAGEIPPLVGQTEFAFNGRGQPLANTPYPFYLVVILDGLSFHRLSFWELQNLSLAFSLVAAAFAAYGGLRWSTLCSRPTAFFLTAAYLFCPAVLANTTANLFMTVHGAVFVPIAIAAVVRQARSYSLHADIVLGASLAAAWLAHPPVAIWLTAVTVFTRLVIHWRDPVFEVRAGIYIAALFGLAAASFVFASVLTMNADAGFSDSPEERLKFVSGIMANLRSAFPGSLLPVHATADSLRDIQLGYTCWALLGFAATAFFSMRSKPVEIGNVDRRRTTATLLGAALLLILFLIPVKYVTRWLWTQLPFSISTTTGPRPMQQLYLVIAGIAVFSTVLTLPVLISRWPKIRRGLPVVAGIALCWMAWQAGFFLRRDFEQQWSEDATRRSHVSSNPDLIAATSVNGVRNHAFEFRLLKGGKQEVASPLRAVELEQLPVRLESLYPLSCTVTSPEPDNMLETPQRYLRNYFCLVNGRSVHPLRSPNGNVMVPVPVGESVVEMRYVGPWFVHAAFWISAASWLAFALWLLGLLIEIDWKWILVRLPGIFVPPARWIFPKTVWILAMGCVGAPLVLMFVGKRNTYLRSIGPVHVRFVLPSKQSGRQQPLVVTGRHRAGTTVFAVYLDDTHIRIGADIWGSAYESQPIKVDYAKVQELVVNASGLYPLDHPRVRALDPLFREELRNDFRVELNGRTVIHETRGAYESTIEDVTFGQMRIGGSLAEPKFDGKILEVERLPFQQLEPLVVSRDQNVRLRLRFPEDRFGSAETLLAIGRRGREGAFAVLYESIGRVRFTQRRPDGSVVSSAVVHYNPKKSHDLQIEMGHARDDENLPILKLAFDGKHVLGPSEIATTEHPWLLQAGLTATEIPGIEARFTGPEITLNTVPKNPDAATGEYGPLRLIAIFPKDKIGRSEPLLTAGKTGAGDFAIVTYVDATHVRFGFDHWGVGAATSELIETDYSVPHEIEISLSSLYPPTSNPWWQKIPAELQTRASSRMEIRFDGKKVVEGPWPAHVSKPEEITPALNRIGGSSCDPAFSGKVRDSRRLGLTH